MAPVDRVFSTSELTELIAKKLPKDDVPREEAPRATLAAPGAVTASTPAPAVRPSVQPFAIVGVHGIGKTQQYAFQDQLAAGLISYLDAREKNANSAHTWRSIVHWPEVEKSQGLPKLEPSALRVYRDDETTPENPTSPVYDVYEGYWAPLTKGKTNAASLLSWLVGCTFLATSSTARVPATFWKFAWDVGYALIAFLIGLAFFVGATVAASVAWFHFLAVFAPNATTLKWEDLAARPISEFASLPLPAYLQLIISVIIAYFFLQLVVIVYTVITTHVRTTRLRKDVENPKQGRFARKTDEALGLHMLAAFASVVAVVLLFILDRAVLAWFQIPNSHELQQYAAWAVVAIALLLGVRYIANFAVDNVLGDIQVYTTHDTTAEFYAIRAAIIAAVAEALLGALEAVGPNRQPLYEKVHVLGHSLGATIALDTLIQLRHLVEERAIPEKTWNRLRSFTTFGSALEKTKFFFDVRHPTVSAAQDQWANDVYGRFFSCKPAVLSANPSGVLYWSNRWYFTDIVANEIISYESEVPAGARSFRFTGASEKICENFKIPHGGLWVHNDYLADPLFWLDVGPVLAN